DAATAHRAHDDCAASGYRHRHACHRRHSSRAPAAARRAGPRAAHRARPGVVRAALTLQLSSPRLTLRSIRESDEELYSELFCDPETMRYIGPPWTRPEAAQAFRGVLAATR